MAGTSDAALGRLARERIDSGRLPCAPAARMWGGRGTGAACALCGRVIKSDEIEYEVELRTHSAGRTLQFHLGCFSVWRSACEGSNGSSP